MHTVDVKKITTVDVTPKLVTELQIAFPATDENPAWDFDMAKKFVANEQNTLLVGKVDGKIAGFLFGHFLDRFDTEKEFFIYELGTAKEFMRQGVMTAIVNFLFDSLRKANFVSSWVLCSRNNKSAMAFYQSVGFTEPNGDDVMFEIKFEK